MERGFVTDAFVQSTIWERLLGVNMMRLRIDTGDSGVGALLSSRSTADEALCLSHAPNMPSEVEVRPPPAK